MPELPKTYEPAAVEPKWYARWEEAGCFRADAHSPKPAFSIVIPPPNVTGILTLGHVLNNTIQDILARRARMQGFEVLWLPGTDHAGVGTQTAVERHLRKTEKKSRHDLGREEFLRRVLDWQDKHGGIIIQQLKRLGCSCDWSRQRYTFDDDYVRAVESVFVDLYGKGLIYRGRRMINWDPSAQTALSDEEVIAKPQKGSLYYIRYEIVEEPGRFLEVATTRPETIMADTGVAVHPSDQRYAGLVGKHAWRPLAREKIPIIADEAIDPKFGTGVLKVTPAHDKLDLEIGQRHQLPIIDVLHPNGKINCPAVPELDGLDRFEARKKAAELLQERGLLAKAEPHQNNVGFSERSEVPIEPRLSEQWFLRYPKTKEALAVVRDHLIRFFPQHWEKVYAQWLENIQDWCISRQIWWGHRIPVWVHRPVSMVRPEFLPARFLPDLDSIGKSGGKWISLSGIGGALTFLRHEELYRDEPGALVTYAATTHEEEQRVLESHGFKQDPDTLDTWFSAWLWAYETMDIETRQKFYPTSVLVTAPDIIFFWVARMIIAGLEFKPGKSDQLKDNIPFHDVFLTGLIRDKQGRKMSKSLGNSPDPLELIKTYGADGLRLGVMRSAPLGSDILFDEKSVELGRNFCTKLWNVARFREMHGVRTDGSIRGELLTTEDRWILSCLDGAVNAVTEALEAYEFSIATNALHVFVWGQLCDWYIEAAKAAYGSGDSEWKQNTSAIIDYVLSISLRLLHPFLPFITEELWMGMGFNEDHPPAEGGHTIMYAPWPRSFVASQSTIHTAPHWQWIDSADWIEPPLHVVVNGARSIRRKFGLSANKRVDFTVWLRGDPPSERELAIQKQLLNAASLDYRREYTSPEGAPHIFSSIGVFYPVLEEAKPEIERDRLDKEIARLENEVRIVEAKLSNASFVDKAPPAVVQEHRQRKTDFSEQLTQLRRARAAMD